MHLCIALLAVFVKYNILHCVIISLNQKIAYPLWSSSLFKIKQVLVLIMLLKITIFPLKQYVLLWDVTK